MKEPNIMDVIQNHKAIYTHPANIPLLKKRFDDQTTTMGNCIASIRGIEIIADQRLDQYDEHWERGDGLPDNKFYTLVEDHELVNPKSWQIFFGLVKKIKEPKFYLSSNKNYTVRNWR